MGTRAVSPGGQSGEITVAGNEAEAIDLACVQQIHGVDDERGIG